MKKGALEAIRFRFSKPPRWHELPESFWIFEIRWHHAENEWKQYLSAFRVALWSLLWSSFSCFLCSCVCSLCVLFCYIVGSTCSLVAHEIRHFICRVRIACVCVSVVRCVRVCPFVSVLVRVCPFCVRCVSAVCLLCGRCVAAVAADVAVKVYLPSPSAP